MEVCGGSAVFNLTIARKPFFLYPGGDHAIKTWGPRVDALYGPGTRDYLGRLGRAAGFQFDFSAQLSDTMDSHRLVLWADRLEAGKGEEVAHELGLQYFTAGVPLDDRKNLLSSVERAGLDTTAAEAYLNSDQGRQEVLDVVQRNQLEKGIHSIPVFIFRSGKLERTVHGSADVDQFVSVLRHIQEQHKMT